MRRAAAAVLGAALVVGCNKTITNPDNPVPDPHGGFAATSSLCTCPVPPPTAATPTTTVVNLKLAVNWTKSQVDDSEGAVRVLKDLSAEVGRFACAVNKDSGSCSGTIENIEVSTDPSAVTRLDVELISRQTPPDILYIGAGTYVPANACSPADCSS